MNKLKNAKKCCQQHPELVGGVAKKLQNLESAAQCAEAPHRPLGGERMYIIITKDRARSWQLLLNFWPPQRVGADEDSHWLKMGLKSAWPACPSSWLVSGTPTLLWLTGGGVLSVEFVMGRWVPAGLLMGQRIERAATFCLKKSLSGLEISQNKPLWTILAIKFYVSEW